MEQLKLLLAYRQDDGVTNAAYYDRFKTRVDVVELRKGGMCRTKAMGTLLYVGTQ
jgi:hypothetical protein